jgi:hypothetical protein
VKADPAKIPDHGAKWDVAKKNMAEVDRVTWRVTAFFRYQKGQSEHEDSQALRFPIWEPNQTSGPFRFSKIDNHPLNAGGLKKGGL